LRNEVHALDRELERLTVEAAPALLVLFGIGPDTGCAPARRRRQPRAAAGFARLCGVSPVEASSGKTTRHRLNRGGDRHANEALYRIVMVRLRHRHTPTIDYVARRTAEGKSKLEIIRCLKRYVAREVYRALTEDHAEACSAA
jgi:transposase